MRLLVLADLHVDRWLEAGRDPLAGLSDETWASVDLCILAGDLTDNAKKHWPRALDRMAERIDPAKTWVFEGNHEYYGTVLDDRGRHAEIAAAQGVGYAQTRAIVHGRHRLLCCTLWTDFRLFGDDLCVEAKRDAVRWMNDYEKVRVAAEGYRRARPDDTVRLHAEHRAWLEARLATPFNGETTVVTHHAPLETCADMRSRTAPAYASDLSDLIREYRPARWLYGHTHKPETFDRDGTRVCNCSIGYPWEVAGVQRRGFGLFDLAEPMKEEDLP